jgi:alkaline phosphatase/alkaline phosphatase D
MVGPDDAYKSDNHVNQKGFRNEGEALFKWLLDKGFLGKNLYFICGDRHWQYHARHPSGFEEFSIGALVDNNARPGRLAGDPSSTDPEGLIKQFYIQGDAESASGGFLFVRVQREDDIPVASFQHFDEKGELLYAIKRQ